MYKRRVGSKWLECPQSKRGVQCIRIVGNSERGFTSRKIRIDTCLTPSNTNQGNHLTLVSPICRLMEDPIQ
jgi:hypothetical protein